MKKYFLKSSCTLHFLEINMFTYILVFCRPRSDDYTVVAVDNNTTGQDLLPTLNKKHRLQLFQDQYVLKISEAERERLDLATDEIDMHTKLRPLNIHEATLATSTNLEDFYLDDNFNPCFSLQNNMQMHLKFLSLLPIQLKMLPM